MDKTIVIIVSVAHVMDKTTVNILSFAILLYMLRIDPPLPRGLKPSLAPKLRIGDEEGKCENGGFPEIQIDLSL